MEDTHVRDTDRRDKLVAVVSIAFTWTYKAGIDAHQHIQPIVIKKHGRKAHSFFKYGLKFITNALLVHPPTAYLLYKCFVMYLEHLYITKQPRITLFGAV